MQKIKTIRSHVGLSRFSDQCKETGLYLARCQVEHIPSPYSYSPSKEILDWDGRPSLERGSFSELVARTLAHWDCARGTACDDYLRAVFPARYEGDL